MIDTAISAYRDLVAEIQVKSDQLTVLHGQNLLCQAGCCSCCRNLSLFRVEFDSIRLSLKQKGQAVTFDETLNCGFLKDNLCTIYADRPLICRTHGLPVFYLDDAKKWQIGFCELNFQKSGSHLFNAENGLNIETMNARLYLLNQEYCRRLGLEADVRVELRRLTEF